MNNALKKISILFVIDGVEFGGGERVFFQLADGLKDRYKVFVATMPGRFFERELRGLGIKVFSVDMKRRLSLKPINRIREIIRNNEIDILHSQGARADFFARIAGRKANVPHIVCTVAMPVEGFDVGPLRKMVYRFTDWFSERYVDRFIVVSDSLKRALIEGRGIVAQGVIRIYNGIEVDQFHPGIQRNNLRAEFKIPTDAPLIGAIGRMVWQKGFKYLLDAAPEIVRAVPDVRFLFVGDGPLKDKLKEKSEKLKVTDRLIFAGFRTDIKAILSTIDLLVVPSLLEGFPMVTLEAMAMAKPVIATNIDGITEQIITGQDGILVPPKDNGALARAIIKVLNDRESAKRMGLAAREKVEKHFSIEKMVNETEKVYLSLIKSN